MADLARFVLEAAEQVLQAAVRRARSVAPDVELSVQLVPGARSRVLSDLGRHAALLVLGGRPLSCRGGIPHRSATERAVSRAGCPVVVVRSRSGVRSGVTRPRVVVGVGPSPAGTAAIGFAFRAAAQRGIPLTALHAWRRDLPADVEAICGQPVATEARAWADLERVLEYWGHRFPDVHVEGKVLPGDPAAALIAESAGAALVVVGFGRHGPLRSRLFGSVGSTVVQQADSPVVVVGSDVTMTSGRGQGARRPMTDAA